jgi:predicted DNA-binding protein
MRKAKKQLIKSFRTTPELVLFLEKLKNDTGLSASYIINDMIRYFMSDPPDSFPIKKKK